ncbi:uncharacterized protein N7458_003037 [Penicillium daleae]|uniref:Uncharacterized protein n=1 Tax=Penicillium daleae TaxID=63821 RepID=A0AAD6G7D5_9EURO|nr:uncharacterized protein N7458_003037 [Penicillium daleae]KAJ5461485.1 hypothetical protein N7458_003037 [Penicillium daleae]
MPTDRDPEDQDRNKKPSNTPQDRDTESESNPFVAFRRFADEQVSSVLQSITGLPSAVSPPQPDHWAIFTDDKDYNSMKYRHRDDASANNAGDQNYTSGGGAESSSSGNRDDNGKPSDNNGGTPISNSSQSRPPAESDLKTSQSRQRLSNEPSDPLSLDALSFPLFSQPFRTNFTFSMPSLFQHFDDQWPLNYITFSPYSPLHLERQARDRPRQEKGVFTSLVSSFREESDRDPNEPQWREAFEDLLRVENGMSLLDSDRLIAGRTESEWDWLKGLVKRGSMGSGFQFVTGLDRDGVFGIRDTETYRDKFSEAAEAEADDELALYERFMQDVEAWERDFSQAFNRSPILCSLVENRQNRDQLEDLGQSDFRRGFPPLEDKQGDDDNESWLDLVSGGNRKSVPETPVESVPSDESLSSHIISTMSRTERTRLADGSVQTKKVVTKRYADGREETDSSVETTHPRSGNADSSSSSGDGESKRKHGWFWKE